jgi:hypothetical protein
MQVVLIDYQNLTMKARWLDFQNPSTTKNQKIDA